MESVTYWPLVLYFVLVIVVAVAMVALSHVLGERNVERDAETPFESGMNPVGTARIRLAAKFYMIAVFFVVFDVEAVYLLAWAIALREAGWAGFIEALIFVVILFAALAYLWKLGALDWAPSARKRRRKS